MGEEEDLGMLAAACFDIGKGRKEYSCITRTKPVQLLLRGAELIGRDDGLEGFFGDVPELLVLGFDEQHDTLGLRVEGAGDMKDGVLNDLLNTGVRDRAAGFQLVVCPTLLHGVHEGRCGVGHLCGR